MVIAIFLAACAIVLPVLVGWLSYNRLMALDEQCNRAQADVDVQLKHRHSLIPGLVETVRGFTGHEFAVLTEVTKARAGAAGAIRPQERQEAEAQVGQSLVALLSVVESYPDLKASTHFRDLRAELHDTENRISAARRFYNLAVNEFNATRRQFPGSLIAGMARLMPREPFGAGLDRAALEEPVAIKF